MPGDYSFKAVILWQWWGGSWPLAAGKTTVSKGERDLESFSYEREGEQINYEYHLNTKPPSSTMGP